MQSLKKILVRYGLQVEDAVGSGKLKALLLSVPDEERDARMKDESSLGEEGYVRVYRDGNKIVAIYVMGGPSELLSEIVIEKKKGNYWQVIGVEAGKPGWGPLAYDIALEVVNARGGRGLIADRINVSQPAQKVWDFYKNKRPDVEAEPLHRGVQRWDRYPRDSPLSFSYTKRGTPILKKLLAAGKLKGPDGKPSKLRVSRRCADPQNTTTERCDFLQRVATHLDVDSSVALRYAAARVAAPPFSKLSPEGAEAFGAFCRSLTYWLGMAQYANLDEMYRVWKGSKELQGWLSRHVNKSSYTLYYGRRLTQSEAVSVGDTLSRKGRGEVLQWTTRPHTAAWFAALDVVNPPASQTFRALWRRPKSTERRSS